MSFVMSGNEARIRNHLIYLILIGSDYIKDERQGRKVGNGRLVLLCD